MAHHISYLLSTFCNLAVIVTSWSEKCDNDEARLVDKDYHCGWCYQVRIRNN